MPRAGCLSCLVVSLAFTAPCSLSQQRPADGQAEQHRQAAVAMLRQLLARAKTPEERAQLEKQLKWIESGEAAREEERIRQTILAAAREALSKAKTDEERDRIAKQVARLERGQPALDEKESLELMGYKVTAPATEPRVYRNATHGYQMTFPAGTELQEHRNGSFVIVKPHGSLFGIWIHAEASTAETEAKLLADFERWCGEHADSARERAEHGGSLRLVPVRQGPFVGYKAVAKDQPDTAPARFHAFKSPRQDGYFGSNLTPSMAKSVIGSLQPLAPSDERK